MFSYRWVEIEHSLSLQIVDAVLDATISMERNPSLSGVVSRSQQKPSFLGYTNQQKKKSGRMCVTKKHSVFFFCESILLIS